MTVNSVRMVSGCHNVNSRKISFLCLPISVKNRKIGKICEGINPVRKIVEYH